MIKETKKAPTIRFRGFTDDWEQRKLSEYLVTSTDKNHAGRFSRADVLSVSGELGIINQIEFQGRSFAGASVLNYGIVKTNDIVYTKSPLKVNPYGIIKANAGKSGIVSTLYAIYHPKQNTDSKFIECYFDSNDRLNHYLRPLVNKGAKNDMKVMNKDVLKGKVDFPPTMKEQRIIASFITEIEMTTALYQRKLDQLKKLKKYFLQNMFPAKGEKVPRIRFKGFTGDWEQRKLGNISAFITKGSTPTTYGYHWVDYGIPFFRNDSIQENTFVYGNYSYISNEANDALKRSEITAKDILIAITGEIGKVGIVPNNIKKANINQHMARVRISKEAVPYFVYQYLATGKIQNEYQKIKTGLSMPQLSLEQIRNTTILLPCYEEQFKISDYLSGLDNLITLHQRKLDQLQTMKKFMLQNMFI